MNHFDGRVLGLETSCDETAAAVVDRGRLLTHRVASQIDLHQRWGGVVPEAAARAHVEALLPILQETLESAGGGRPDAIVVTNRPGLVGALSVGVTAAKTLAAAWKVPLLGVHHLEGHLWSILAVEPNPPLPHLALIVSGGHTELVRVDGPGSYEILGETRDDAAGEAFDKSARLLGLGYPGGKAIQDAAIGGNPHRYTLPKGLSGGTMEFSFSGLKTAVLRLVEKEGAAISIPDAAASVQEAIVSVLAERTARAAERNGVSCVSLVGGVAANKPLRERTAQLLERKGLRLIVPPIDLCTDNAGMIALAGSLRLAQGLRDDRTLEPYPVENLGG